MHTYIHDTALSSPSRTHDICTHTESPRTGTGCLTLFGNGECNDGFLGTQASDGMAWHTRRRLNLNCHEWMYDGGDCHSSAVHDAGSDAGSSTCWAGLPPGNDDVYEDIQTGTLTQHMASTIPQCEKSSSRGFCFADCVGTCFNLNSTVSVVSSSTTTTGTHAVLARDLFGDSICDRGQRGLDLSCSHLFYDVGDCHNPSVQDAVGGSEGRGEGGEAAQTIHLLHVAPMTGSWDGGMTAKPGIDLATHLINTRKAGWDVGLPQGYTLQVHWRDSKCDFITGWNEYLNFIDDPSLERVVGIIGCGCSAVCESINLHATKRNIPQLSYGCTAPNLYDPVSVHEDGLFTSLMGTEMAQVEAWIQLCLTFNWTRVATIHDYEYPLFRLPIHRFLELADAHDIQVRSKSFSSKSCKESVEHDGDGDPNFIPNCFDAVLDEIEEEGFVIVFYLMYFEQMQQMFASVYERHPLMTSTPGRVWMGPGWYNDPPNEWRRESLLGGAAYSYAIREVYNPEGTKRGRGHDDYWSNFTSLFPNWNTAGFSAMPSIETCVDTNSTAANTIVANPRLFNTSDLYGFDAVFAFASAFARILNETEHDMHELHNGVRVMDALMDPDMIVDGVSGKLIFSNRRRLIDYTLVNVQPAEAVEPCNETQWIYAEVGTFKSTIGSDDGNPTSMQLTINSYNALAFHGGILENEETTAHLVFNGPHSMSWMLSEVEEDNQTVSAESQCVQEWTNATQIKWEPLRNLTWPLDYNRVCTPGTYYDSIARHCMECTDSDTACMDSIKIPCHSLDDRSTLCTKDGIFARANYWFDSIGYEELVSNIKYESTSVLVDKGNDFAARVKDYLYECGPNLCVGNTKMTCTNVLATSPRQRRMWNSDYGPITETRKCACHHHGVLCTECEYGYVKSLGSCQMCETSSKNGFTLAVVFTVIMLVIFALFILIYSGESQKGNGTIKIVIFFIHIISLLVKQMDKSLVNIISIITFDIEQTGEANSRPTDCYYGYFPATRMFIAKIVLFALIILMVFLAAIGQLYYIRRYSYETFSYYQLTILSIVPNLLDRVFHMWYAACSEVSSRFTAIYHNSKLYQKYVRPKQLARLRSSENANTVREPSLIVIRAGKVRRYAASKVVNILRSDTHEAADMRKSISKLRYREILRRTSKVEPETSGSCGLDDLNTYSDDDIEHNRRQVRLERMREVEESLANTSVKYHKVRPSTTENDASRARDGLPTIAKTNAGEAAGSNGGGTSSSSSDQKNDFEAETECAPVPLVRSHFQTFQTVVNASEKIKRNTSSQGKLRERKTSEIHADDKLAYWTIATLLDGVPYVMSRIWYFFSSISKPSATETNFWKNVTVGSKDSRKDKKRVAATFSTMMTNVYTYLFFPTVMLAGEILTCREVMNRGKPEMRLVFDPEVTCERSFFFTKAKGDTDHRSVFILACVMLGVLFGFTISIFNGVQQTIRARKEALAERKTASDGHKIQHWMSMQQRFGAIILRYKPGSLYTNMYFVELARDLVLALLFTTIHSPQMRVFGCAWVLALFGMQHCLMFPYYEMQDNVLMSLAYFFLFVVTFCLESESMSMVKGSAFTVAQLLFWVFISIALLFIYYCSSFERFRGLLEMLNAYTAYSERRQKRTYKIVMRVHPDLRCTVSWSINFEKRIEQNMSVLPPQWGFVVNELFCFSQKVVRREQLKRKGTAWAKLEAQRIATELHDLGYSFHEYQLHVLCTSDGIPLVDVDGSKNGSSAGVRGAPKTDGFLERTGRDIDGKSGEGHDDATQWKQIYPNAESMRHGVFHGSSTNCTFKEMFNGMRRGTFILRLRVFDRGLSSEERDLALGAGGRRTHTVSDDHLIQQTFFEFDLETFTSCEVSKRFPQIHFSRSFVDLDSRKGPALYDVVKMSTVMSDGSEQSTVVFNQHDVDDDVIDHEKDEPNP